MNNPFNESNPVHLVDKFRRLLFGDPAPKEGRELSETKEEFVSKDEFLDHRGWEDRQVKRMSLEKRQAEEVRNSRRDS